jgi:hypothetical protein
METQLRDRYLKNNSCKNGIYLVGWFAGARWRDTDRRKGQCPQMTVSEAEELFWQQAAGLSEDGYLIRSYILDLALS